MQARRNETPCALPDQPVTRRCFNVEFPPTSSGRDGVPSVSQIWRHPLPALADLPLTRLICRLVTTAFRWQVREIRGLQYVAPERDPFILALNHSQRPEAVVVPTWLCFHRAGRMVHFLADWNFLLIPGLAAIIRRHDPIVVVRKDARPRFLNRFKSRFVTGRAPFEEARRRLEAGRSVGIFPEATTNRHPTELLRGQAGVARLALETGVAVVPGGIRFPFHRGTRPIGDRERFTVEFGPPLSPPEAGEEGDGTAAGFHEQIMRAISTLSGKQWQPDARRTKHAFDQA